MKIRLIDVDSEIGDDEQTRAAPAERTMSLVQTILREREVLNERRVAVARLALISGAVCLDLLAYAGWVKTTLTPPSGATIAIDAVFLTFAAAVLQVARRPGYRPVFKYIVMIVEPCS